LFDISVHVHLVQKFEKIQNIEMKRPELRTSLLEDMVEAPS
jgi:hypothetical protein